MEIDLRGDMALSTRLGTHISARGEPLGQPNDNNPAATRRRVQQTLGEPYGTYNWGVGFHALRTHGGHQRLPLRFSLTMNEGEGFDARQTVRAATSGFPYSTARVSLLKLLA